MNDKRIVFLDYLRVFAIFMVMVVHCCEQFYFNGDGDFHIASAGDAMHRFVIRPLSEASFGVYLLHMLVLVEVIARLRDDMTTPTTIVVGALATYLIASLVSLVIRRIPFVGKWICG